MDGARPLQQRGDRTPLLHRLAVVARRAEEIPVEPGLLLFELAPLVGDLSQAVGLAGEQHEPRIGLGRLLQGAEQRPGLARRDVPVVGPGEDDGGRRDRREAEERRLRDVEVGLLERGRAEVVVVEGSAEVHVSPVADPLDVRGADGRRTVAPRARDQLHAQDAAVAPAGGGKTVGVRETAGDRRVDTLLDVGDLQLVVLAADGLDPVEAVADAPVVVHLEHESSLLPPQQQRRAPRGRPRVAVHAGGASVDVEDQGAPLSLLPVERVVEEPLDGLAVRPGPPHDLHPPRRLPLERSVQAAGLLRRDDLRSVEARDEDLRGRARGRALVRERPAVPREGEAVEARGMLSLEVGPSPSRAGADEACRPEPHAVGEQRDAAVRSGLARPLDPPRRSEVHPRRAPARDIVEVQLGNRRGAVHGVPAEVVHEEEAGAVRRPPHVVRADRPVLEQGAGFQRREVEKLGSRRDLLVVLVREAALGDDDGLLPVGRDREGFDPVLVAREARKLAAFEGGLEQPHGRGPLRVVHDESAVLRVLALPLPQRGRLRRGDQESLRVLPSERLDAAVEARDRVGLAAAGGNRPDLRPGLVDVLLRSRYRAARQERDRRPVRRERGGRDRVGAPRELDGGSALDPRQPQVRDALLVAVHLLHRRPDPRDEPPIVRHGDVPDGLAGDHVVHGPARGGRNRRGEGRGRREREEEDGRGEDAKSHDGLPFEVRGRDCSALRRARKAGTRSSEAGRRGSAGGSAARVTRRACPEGETLGRVGARASGGRQRGFATKGRCQPVSGWSR